MRRGRQRGRMGVRLDREGEAGRKDGREAG